MCLTCGNLGCGRKNYDGSGGNNHGVEHYEKTDHCVNVKIGTIKPEGKASIHCYKCDNEVLDNNLAVHLSIKYEKYIDMISNKKYWYVNILQKELK